MEKKVVVLLSMILLIISANMETVESQGVNCYDNCNTACVGLKPRLYLRCDRKCQIRCGPAREVNGIQANEDLH